MSEAKPGSPRKTLFDRMMAVQAKGSQAALTTPERARNLYEQLMALPRPAGMSNNEWTKLAGVNTSFFTNLKNGSEPSVGNLRAVLNAVGVSLPEFFLDEAKGRLSILRTTEDLTQAIADALPGLPRSPDKRARYLAEVVQAYLSTPGVLPSRMDHAGEKSEAAA